MIQILTFDPFFFLLTLRFVSQLAWKTRIKYCTLFRKQLRLLNNGLEHKRNEPQ